MLMEIAFCWPQHHREWYEMNNTDVSIVRACVYTVEDSENGILIRHRV